MQTVTDLLNFLETPHSIERDSFVDLHILNDCVVGFYKTFHVKYKDCYGNNISYLFPTTFKLINDNIHTTMIFGSVTRNFIQPKVNGEVDGTKLNVMSVKSHLYQLLVATQYVPNIDECRHGYGFTIKPFICIIEALAILKFPFIRITNNNAILDENINKF